MELVHERQVPLMSVISARFLFLVIAGSGQI